MRSALIILALLLSNNIFSQTTTHNSALEKKTWDLAYDPTILRIPGNKLPVEILKNGKTDRKQSLFGTKTRWTKYKVDIKGGVFRNGRIFISDSTGYMKGKALEVTVYSKDSSKLLFTKRIPYNYETAVQLLTRTPLGKVPGSITKYGFRIYYDNGDYTDLWPSDPRFRLNFFNVDSTELVSRNKTDRFLLSSHNGYFLKRYLVIEEDPFKITDHSSSFSIALAKNPSLADTLYTNLNYIFNYYYDSQRVRNYCLNTDDEEKNHPLIFSRGHYSDDGHDLDVFADLYEDSIISDPLLRITITDLNNCETYNYLVNVNGGTIKIYSRGYDGSDGSNGSDGSDGTNGSDGSSGSSGSTVTKYVTDSNGKQSSYTEEGPGGDGSNGSSGSDGSDGGNGSDGKDGGDGGNIQFHYTSAVTPYLHLIDIRSIPGDGGDGGKGGEGGSGGKGGKGGRGGSGNPNGRNGSDGTNGRDGSDGRNGSDGRDGRPGNVVRVCVD
jgi:hypothetical protein